MVPAPQQTRFFELAGDHAAERLRLLGTHLRAAGAHVTLLASRDQQGLFLLVAESASFPDTRPPAGTRVWTFERLAA